MVNNVVKIVFKKMVKYGIVIGIPVTVLIAFFEVSGAPYISTILMYLYLFYIIFDIGWSIKSKSARKRYIIYMGIFILIVVLLTVLGNIFGFRTYVSSETENSLLDAISTFIILGTLTGMLIKIVHDCKKQYPAVKLLYFPISVFGLGLVAVWFTI
jgi:uncharacterized membrane protein YhaH (DUF805 family)